MKTISNTKELSKKEKLELNGGSEFSLACARLIGYSARRVGIAMRVVSSLGGGRGF